jgi:hypothetical protein
VPRAPLRGPHTRCYGKVMQKEKRTVGLARTILERRLTSNLAANAASLILAFRVRSSGPVTRSDELEDLARAPKERRKPWSFGTGLAERDGLERGRLVPRQAVSRTPGP